MSDNLEFDEADRQDRWRIWRSFLDDHLFDEEMDDEEFVTGLWVRHAAYVAASSRLLTLLELKKPANATTHSHG